MVGQKKANRRSRFHSIVIMPSSRLGWRLIVDCFRAHILCRYTSTMQTNHDQAFSRIFRRLGSTMQTNHDQAFLGSLGV